MRETVLESAVLTELFVQSPGIVGACKGPDHVIDFMNPAFEHLIGHRQVIGERVRDAFPELASNGLIEILDKVLKTGEPYVAQQRRVELQQHAEAEKTDVYFDFVYQPIRNQDGTIIGIFGQGHDVTRQVKAQGRANALQALLVRNSKQSGMDSMGAMLAHELNQPLTVIVNSLRATRNFINVPTPANLAMAKEALTDIEQASLRAGELIRRLRDTVSRGHVRNNPESLAEIVRDALDLTAVARTQHGISCRIDIAPDIIVQGDRIQLQQVFLNLINNAVEAMIDVPTRVIGIAATPMGSLVCVNVSDSGPGLDPRVAEQIFDPMYTTKETGLGLGLCICRAILEAHGGSIALADTIEPGAALTVIIPCKISPES